MCNFLIDINQIEEHYGANGMGIVGYFHANERFDDAELGILAKNIGDHICRYVPQAAILLVCIKWQSLFSMLLCFPFNS